MLPRWLLYLLFFTIAGAVVGAAHLYLYRRLVVSTALPPPWATVGRLAIVALGVSIPLSFVVARLLSGSLVRYLVFPVYLWLGLLLMLFFVLLGIDLLRGAAWVAARAAGRQDLLSDPARRLLLARATAGLAGATVLSAAAVGMGRCLGRVSVKRLEVTLDRLPPPLSGFTIVQLSDLHLGPMRRPEWTAELVRRVQGLRPDLVAITGDLVDGSVEQLTSQVAPLAKLAPPQGVFFVTGNHEYFVDPIGWLHHLRGLGIRVLRNERVTIRPGGPGRPCFDLAGVDDHEGRRFAPGHGADIPRATRDPSPGRPVVMLAHQPRAVLEACEHQVDLVLSGHTHGGQIWPWRYMVYLQQPYVSGLHRRRSTWIYVSEGTGYWGPPIRLGSTAEITHITLRSPSGSAVRGVR